MAINYYCSGFDINDAFWEELGNKFKKELKDMKSIVYIPGGVSKIEKARDKYIPIFTENFKRIGIEFEEVNLITPDLDSDSAKRLVRDASFVMLMGGCPYSQKELCEQLDLVDTLKEYDGVLLGISAGAMLMSKYIIIVPCSLEYPNFHIEEGLGLSDISIYPHNNFEGVSFPDEVILEDEITKTKDLIKVASEYGEFYLLQDYFNSDGKTEVSLIRSSGNDVEFITNNNGKIWKACEDGIKLVVGDNII